MTRETMPFWLIWLITLGGFAVLAGVVVVLVVLPEWVVVAFLATLGGVLLVTMFATVVADLIRGDGRYWGDDY